MIEYGSYVAGRIYERVHGNTAWNSSLVDIYAATEWRIAEIAPELTGHGLPLGKCEAYNRVYDQFYQSR
jgi:hypothetical protein